MLLFGQRRRLQSLYLKWCEENNVAQVPMSMISFLQGNGLIDEDKAVAFLAKAWPEHIEEIRKEGDQCQT